MSRIRAAIITLLGSLLLPGTLCAQIPLLSASTPPPVLETGDNGKYQLSVPEKAGHYGILYRSTDLLKWTPVDIKLLDQPETRFYDSTLPVDLGFFKVENVPYSKPLDLDRDGFNDLVEINSSGGPMSALNAARLLEETDGSNTLFSQDVFDRLAKRDNFPGAQNVKEVKFLITNIRTQPSLYFIDVARHQFHYSFARNVLKRYQEYSFYRGNSIFTQETYFSNTSRKNLAGSIVAHDNYIAPDGSKGIYTLEFWPTDPVDFEWVELAYEMISRSAPFINRLAYHAPSETQRAVKRQQQNSFDNSFVSTIETEELFANTEYQPMHQREAFGRLRLATDSGTLSTRDIVIFSSLPNDLTHIAGIITEVPQTPLSHVNLKAQQNDTPNAFIANASTHPDIAPFLGQNIYYRVDPEGFKIRLATQEEVDTFFEEIRPPNTSFPPRDLSNTTITPLSQIAFEQSTSFGAKAANLAHLRSLFPDNTPDGFAIPFYFYDEFMKHNGFYAEAAAAMMNNYDFLTNPSIREDRLKDFRSRIKQEGSFPSWMYEALTTLQNSFPQEITPRLRSSANAEDTITFNGAGLYDSFTHKEDEGHIGKSVRQVWASLWNYRAFEEREFHRIDHFASAMGILVHPNFKDEQSNGVAVARNIFDPNWEGYYINVQVGEDLVTNPDSNSIPEEMLVADLLGAERYEIQYIRFSNQLEDGERVLTKDQVLDLVSKMATLNTSFRRLYDSNSSRFAMEIEFKITEDGELSIKQARPWVN